MKRLLALALCLLMALSVFACTKKGATTDDPSTTDVPANGDSAVVTDTPLADETIKPTDEPTAAPIVYAGYLALPSDWSYHPDSPVQYNNADSSVLIQITEVGRTAVEYLDKTVEEWQTSYDDANLAYTVTGIERVQLNETEACIVHRTDADGAVGDIYVIWTDAMTYFFVIASTSGQTGLDAARTVMDTFKPIDAA